MKVEVKTIKNGNKTAFEIVADNVLICTLSNATAVMTMLLQIGAAIGQCMKGNVIVKFLGENES